MPVQNLSAFQTEAEYIAQVRAIMQQLEGRSATPYFDTAGVITIGIGINIDIGANRQYVLGTTMGQNANALDAAWADPQLATIRAMPQGNQTQLNAKNLALRTYLNGQLGVAFTLTDPQIDSSFEHFSEVHRNAVANLLPGFSREEAALVSLHYNGLVGPGLTAALQLADPYEARAEAWYQIRYSHANQLFKRRYTEAAIFGLYGSNVPGPDSAQQAIGIYRMYSRHGSMETVPGSNLDMIQYDATHAAELNLVQAELNAMQLNNLQAQTLREELRPAHDALVLTYITNANLAGAPTIDPLNVRVAFDNTNVVGEDTTTRTGSNSDLLIGRDNQADRLQGRSGSDVLIGLSGNDTLEGGDGNDILSGGTGVDNLEGGEGADTLDGVDGPLLSDAEGDTMNGGDGADTYYADNEDHIIDSDGTGTVFYGAARVQLTGGSRSQGETLFLSADHTVVYEERPNGEIVAYTPAGRITVRGPNQSGRDGSTQTANGDLITGLVTMGIPLLTLHGPSNAPTPSIPQQIWGQYLLYSSPVALDLDGDGVETRGLGEGAYFDYDGDGFRERTGWIGSDDAFLVRDQNGDGIISSGAETFGDRTPLQNGSFAMDGYEALRDLDSNVDGVLDVNDTAWSTLQLWRDNDADGLTDDGELLSLESMEIRSINVNTLMVGNGLDAHGNDHRWAAHFTRTNGTLGMSADIWFRTHLTDSLQQETIPLSEAVAELPELRGYGTLYDLRQVIMRDGTGELASLVNAFDSELSQQARISLMDQIIVAWTGSQDVEPGSRGIHANAEHASILEQITGMEYLNNIDAGNASLIEGNYFRIREMYYHELMRQTHFEGLFSKAKFTWDSSSERVMVDLSDVTPDVVSAITSDPNNAGAFLSEFIFSLRASYQSVAWNSAGLRDAVELVDPTLLAAYDQAWVSVLGTSNIDMMFGTNDSETFYAFQGNDRIRASGGNDTLYGGDGQEFLYGEAGNDYLDGGEGFDYLYGGEGADTFHFGIGSGFDLVIFEDTVSQDILRFGVGVTPENLKVSRVLNPGGMEYGGLLFELNANDRISMDYFDGEGMLAKAGGIRQVVFADGTIWTHQQILDSVQPNGTDGDDALLGFETPDLINGLGGNDTLDGRAGDDVLDGGAGQDDLHGGAGNDTLDGGTGNDSLTGGIGNDIYLFDRGGGQDTILRHGFASGDSNTLRLGQGISVSDIQVVRTASHIGISIVGTQDQVALNHWFVPYTGNADLVTSVEFADGTIWTSADLLAASTNIAALGSDNANFSGTAGNDFLTGLLGSDTLSGLGGNDFLTGAGGSDLLYGGDGDDQIFGGGQYDNLYGEAGSDTLDGGDDSDNLFGGDDNDFLYGREGSDWLNGDSGEDLLDGGTDGVTDILHGGSGNDTYVFGRGYGADTLSDADGTAGTDTIRMLSGINPEDIILSRLPFGNNRILTIAGTNDSITIEGWYSNASYRIERVEFANGVIWTSEDIGGLNEVDGDANMNFLMGTGDRDRIRGFAGNDYLFGNDNHDILEGGADSDQLYGGNGNDQLNGGDGVDGLSGGIGDDEFDGGAGNDNLTDESGADTYLFGRGSGNDWISDQGSAGDIDSIVFGAGVLVGDVQVFLRNGALRLEIIDSGEFIAVGNWMSYPSYRIEQVRFADGTTWTNFDQGSYEILGDDLDNNEVGSELADVVHLRGGNDSISALGGDDYIDGGTGADSMYGGVGNDTYIVDDAMDALGEYQDEGIDTVLSSVTYALSSNIENLHLTGTAPINAIGNESSNTLIGNSGANLLDGGTGADTLQGGLGDDTYVIDDLGDVVVENADEGTDTVQSYVSATLAANFENLTLLGAAMTGTGNASANVISGNTVANTLDGGSGADTLIGASGNDIYIVDNALDAVLENSNEGTDTVNASVSYTLTNNVENLILVGTNALTGTGNGLNNALTGNAFDNTLDGGVGNDTLTGGLGNDTYVVDSANDVVSEAAGQGTDTVRVATGSYTLSNNVENLTMISGGVNGWGNSLDNVLIGNSADNLLVGSGGNDTLDGGAGIDSLLGGLGNDLYIVDNTLDGIAENPSEGTDTVQSTASFTLFDNVEHLTLMGVGAINGTGNSSANTITGSSADNVINGAGGNDTMIGGLGNDTYVVDQSGDVVTESASEGTDTVQASITYLLTSHVENLTLTGSGTINATGNALDNVLIGNGVNNTLTGNDGNDTLDGGVGTDTMVGGAGNDTYFVNVSGDVTTETANQGIDLVNSGVTRTLANHIELLFLTGSTAINGTGNALANMLRGNGVNNTLSGAGGNDILEGGAGNDTLSNTSGNSLFNGGSGTDTITGTSNNDLLIGGIGNDALTTGTGADIIAFNKGDGQDTVAVSTTKDNTVSIGGGTVYADLLFLKSGNNLVLKVGTADQITFTNYYSSASNRSVNTLQVIIEGTSDYDAGSSSVINNKKIETFNFGGLVAAFDAARTANPTLTTWALSNALVTQYLAGSDSAALGGDLGYRYGRFSNLSDISFNAASALLSSGTFGSASQALQPLGGLQDSTPRLS